MAVSPLITISPESALIDEEQIISVKDLAKEQEISIYVTTTLESGFRFSSLGCFKANQHGVVDLSKDTSINGTYKGVDSMGLFWSMKAEPGYETKRFMKLDVTTPVIYSIYVYFGIHTLNDIQHCPKACVASREIHRWYKDKDVRRLQVKEGMVIGTLFIPKGKGPFPAVIDMFGGTGGLTEFRAALLGSRGFLTLALPYLLYEGLPPKDKIFKDFTYFKENIRWLANHHLAVPGGIGIIGVSFGGFLANTLSLKCKEIKATVMINCPPYRPIRPVYADYRMILPMIIESCRDPYTETPEGFESKFLYVHYEERLSKSWESNSKYLCIVGGDDRIINPWYLEYWYSRWPSDQRHRIKLLKYKDAGHLIEPPFSPLNRVTFLKLAECYNVWGGKPEGHAYGQKDSWKQMLMFLRENLYQKNMLKSAM